MNKRNVIESKTFENTGSDFSAYYAACKWLEEREYSYGSSCLFCPVAIFKGKDHYVSKWRNLSSKEKNDIDGLLSYDDSRNGDVKVELYV